MKKQCENPNGLANMKAIKDSKAKKLMIFNTLWNVKQYLTEHNYRLLSNYSHKNDVYKLYRKGSKVISVKYRPVDICFNCHTTIYLIGEPKFPKSPYFSFTKSLNCFAVSITSCAE